MNSTTTPYFVAHAATEVPLIERAAVLVPLDGSEESLAALPVARVIAELEQADLHLVNVASSPVPAQLLLRQLGIDPREVRGTIVDQATGEPAAQIVRLASQQRSPYLVICPCTARAREKTGTGPEPARPFPAGAASGEPPRPVAAQPAEAHLGHVAKEVLRTAPCPVVAVPAARGQQPWQLRHILLPYDGTPTTSAAADPAMDLSDRSGAELIVLHVTAAGAVAPHEPGSIVPPRYVDQAHHEWPTWMWEFLERVSHRTGTAGKLRPALAVGEVGTEILRFAQAGQVDLIVLGWHGNWEEEHAHAVKTVIREAACPVLLLRLPERKLDAASGPGRVPAPAAFKANQFDAMILDLDGVITRTATIHARAWKRMFDDYLRRREAERREPFRPFDQVADYRRYVDGKPRYDGVRSFLESRGIHLPEGTPSDPPGQETICGLGNLKDQWFLNLLVEGGGVEVFEDTLDALRRWRALGLKTAVVSSSKNCDLVLRAAGLVELFDVRVDGNTAEELRLPGKPAPDTFLEAAHRLGVAPSRAAVFEDACAGVQAGRHGHFGTVVGVARQESQLAALQEAGADVVVRDLREFRLEE